MRGLFVTGTDTDAGKTVLSCALLAAMAAEGTAVAAHKPAVTGLEQQAGHGDGDGPAPWPPDHELLGMVAAMAPELVAPLRFGPAVSPLLAGELAGEPPRPEQLLKAAQAAVHEAQEREATLIVEGAGGLLSPLAENFTVCDLAAALRLPLLIAARPGLGTINHSLLTLQAARAAALDVRAIVLTPWPQEPSRLQRSNAEAITRFGFVELDTLAHVAAPTRDRLAQAGAALPWRRWLGERPAVAQPA